MNLKYTRTIIFLSAFALLYMGCKKNTVKSPDTTSTNTTEVNYATLSSQISATLYRSVTGQYGGTDISKGIKSPFSTKAYGHNALTTFDINPLCGYIIDTAYNYTTHSGDQSHMSAGDTLYTNAGHFKFQYACEGGTLNGYTVADSIGFASSFLWFNYSSTVAQDYVVKALDQTYKLVSMDGTIATATATKNTDEQTGNSLTAAYTLTALKVAFTAGVADITSGTSTFQMINYPQHFLYNPIQPTVYDGTIEYLGNHKAKLTINPGHVYMVNLTTGVATAV